MTKRRILWSILLPSPPGFDVGQEDAERRVLPVGAEAIVGISTDLAFTALRLSVNGRDDVIDRLSMPAGQVIPGLYIPLPLNPRSPIVPRFVGTATAPFTLTLTLEMREDT